MNILVIGNGFDLAHGLPTKYGDFLDFCERVREIYTYDEEVLLNDYRSKNIDDWNMNDYIKNALLEAFEKRNCEIIQSVLRLQHLIKHWMKCMNILGKMCGLNIF